MTLIGSPGDLEEIESLDWIEVGGSDVGPGMTAGAGSLWLTAPNALTRFRLEI
jgi:hypothetical protein